VPLQLCVAVRLPLSLTVLLEEGEMEGLEPVLRVPVGEALALEHRDTVLEGVEAAVGVAEPVPLAVPVALAVEEALTLAEPLMLPVLEELAQVLREGVALTEAEAQVLLLLEGVLRPVPLPV